MQGKLSDEATQRVMKDILTGLKTKMIQPVMEETMGVAAVLNDLRNLQQQNQQDLNNRLSQLEAKVDQIPLTVLGAIRDAINQSGGEE